MQTYHHAQLRFLLEEVFPLKALYRYPRYSHLSVEVSDMMLSAADDLAAHHLYPLLRPMDENPPRMKDGRIVVHPDMKALMKLFGEGGWITMNAPLHAGGQQLPNTLFQSLAFILASANYGATAFPLLTAGAAHLIESFGSDELKATYLPKMYAGQWQGTMALTEPQAGSSLSDLTTTARPTDQGHYLIKGQKVFISCGDHDACENIVHLMLARIEGAPAGTKGISLFLVPRLRPEGDRLVPNDLQTAGCFHKMGYHGAPIAHLIMGEQEDCRGFLVGNPHEGLSYMFQMMNEARIGVGQQAISIAAAAYYYSLDYAKTRHQGRHPNEKQAGVPPIPIIEHADVKRLLLFQKSIVEGSLSLILQATWYFDLMLTATTEEEREKYYFLLELLTPVVKSYPAEMSILTTSAGMQCLGGYGYTKEFLAELYFRETRIHTIHEGTTAIHGMDLLGRKLRMGQGKALMYLKSEIETTLDAAAHIPELKDRADQLSRKLQDYQGLLMHLMGVAQSKGVLHYLADATLFLEYTGILLVGWQWLKQMEKAHAVGAAEMKEKLAPAFVYYFEYELPKMNGLLERLRSTVYPTMEVSAEAFS